MPETTLYCFQHVPFEGPGLIRLWAKERGFSIKCIPLYRKGACPDPSGAPLLIIMGGPMGVHDTDRYPWLHEEKTVIESALKAGTRVLGVCLGAQLLADVLGSRVYTGSTREIGWFPIRRADEAATHPIGQVFPETLEVFHWHAETFDLPEGASRLAGSPACLNQAFIYDGIALGLQFHLEMGQQEVEAIIEACRNDITPGPYIQSADEMVKQSVKVESTKPVLFRLLDLFLD